MTVSVNDYLFGPPSSFTVGGVEIGPSEDPAKLTVTETFQTIDLQNAASEIAGLVRLSKVKAELTTKLNQLSLAMLQKVLHNITPTVGTAAVTGGGLSTTLSADVAAGATSIVVASAAGMADNLFFKVGDASETEIVKVDPAWTSGTTIPLTTPLIRAHDAGDAVVQVDNAGTTILRQRTGFVATAQHLDVVMQAVGPDGNPTLVTLFDTLNTAGISMAFGVSESAGTPVTFTAYADITDPTLAPYAIERLTV